MNPVDHPHGGVSAGRSNGCWDVRDLTWRYRVTTNISVRRRPSRGTLRLVKRRVSLLRGGRVCCVVPRRQRIKCVHGSTSGQGVHRIALVFCCFVVTELRRRTGNLLICASGHGREMNKIFPNAVRKGFVTGQCTRRSSAAGRSQAGHAVREYSWESSSASSSLPGDTARHPNRAVTGRVSWESADHGMSSMARNPVQYNANPEPREQITPPAFF